MENRYGKYRSIVVEFRDVTIASLAFHFSQDA